MGSGKNGFVSFPNDIFDAILTAELTGGEIKVLLAVIRQTIGYNITKKAIPISQLQSMTGLSKGVTHRALTMLKNRNIVNVAKQSGNNPQIISINLDVSTWQEFPLVKKCSTEETQSVLCREHKCSTEETQTFCVGNTSVSPVEHILYKDNITDMEKTSADAHQSPAKPQKHKFGEYKNVLLTDEEYQKLKAEMPNADGYIERLSSYVASTGKAYKSHFATIRNWYRKDCEKNGQNTKDNPADENTAPVFGRRGVFL